MANVIRQTLTANVIPESQYGVGYDVIKIDTLFETDTPIPQDMAWYIPAGPVIPQYIIDLIEKSGQEIPYLHPIPASYFEGVEDVQIQAASGNEEEVLKDVSRLLLESVLKKVVFTPINGNVYQYSYEIKAQADQNGNFKFKFFIPLKGLGYQGMNEVSADIILPKGANLDAAVTQGQDPNGNVIEEQVVSTNTNRKVVSFYYKTDPEFIVSYRY